MLEDVLVPIAFFASIVIPILYVTKYNHDFRMKLLEKDISPQDLSELLKSKKTRRDATSYRTALLFGILLLFIGFGICAGEIIYNYYSRDIVYPTTVFVAAGIGLIGFYYMTQAESREQSKKDQDEH
jgi:hypothetical protein